MAKPSSSPPEIDTLMARIEAINATDPLALTPADIDDLITYHRRSRARKAAGEKPAAHNPAPADIAKLLDSIAPAKPTPKLNLSFLKPKATPS